MVTRREAEMNQKWWEATFIFEATEAEAAALFELASEAICGCEGEDECTREMAGALKPASDTDSECLHHQESFMERVKRKMMRG